MNLISIFIYNVGGVELTDLQNKGNILRLSAKLYFVNKKNNFGG
jgi:hypothetical protein